ncbi:MAG: YitT family protein [Bacteroidales bacterium]|nr:YitT family protein [Bacteroidales bacterium]
MNAKKVLKEVQNYFFICIGLALFTFGWTAFLIPNQVTGGGISGIAAIIYFASGTIPVGVTTLVLNLILVSFAWKVLGKKFCIDTLICTVILSLFMSLGQYLFPEPLVKDDPFMCAMIGAALSGFGVGLALTYGGNTGGTDIIVLMISKYRNISFGKVTLYLNIFIVLSSYFIVQSLDKLVYSVVVLFAYIFISDIVIDGYKQTFQFMVFSSKNHEIAEKINTELKRGATFLKGVGSYNKQETEVLLIIAHRTDKANIIRIIKEIDSGAFISISKAQSVFGKNFERIR